MAEPDVHVWWAFPHAGADRADAARLARVAVARVRAVDPADVVVTHRCGVCGSTAHGAPTTAGVHLSITRAPGLVAVAVSTTGPVGIDVERRTDQVFAGFDDVVLAPTERADDAEDRLRTWVRKEAVLKACGLGLTVDPRLVVLDGTRVTSAPPAVGPVDLHDVDPDGYLGAVAVPVGARLVAGPTPLTP
ncbi:MAG TPA: 4'-phosphopantetheinyl transferase superfamily protein [Cellulomonas sp.]|nr:4'-phosphopantetheinyl transferase superfamily protein [Cellulomonas sp.]